MEQGMNEGKNYTRIGDLAKGIAADISKLEDGKLPLPELESLSDRARELHERLIVLRHKAREAKVVPAVVAVPVTAAPRAMEEVAPPVVREPPTMRLDTAPKQTSLIDAIAEVEVPAPKVPEPPAVPVKVSAPEQEKPTPPPYKPEPPLPSAKDPKPQSPRVESGTTPVKVGQRVEVKPVTAASKQVISVGEKLERAPIADLGKAVALSQKFWFVAELFGGDRNAYERAIDQLNKAAGRDEAKAFLQEEVVGKLKNPPGEDVLAAFNELIERRHR
jgi:hypothetical protein